MGDDRRNANPAQRQEKRAARLCAIQNIGQPRHVGFRSAGALDLRGKGAERRVAIGHALADGLRGGQRAGGFMRVKRRRREIRKERKHLPRGFVRLQKAEHAAAAGDEHRRAGGGMIVVPLVAFDRTGARLGYGGGCYDLYLSTLSASCQIIGTAFDEQRVEHVPTDAHDLPLPNIISA